MARNRYLAAVPTITSRRTAVPPTVTTSPAFEVTVADDALVAVMGLQIGMLAEKVCDLGLDRLGEKGTCPVAQDGCAPAGTRRAFRARPPASPVCRDRAHLACALRDG